MRLARHRIALGAALLIAAPAVASDSSGTASSPADSSWQVLVPAGRLGRFSLRVERAEFAGSVAQVATRIARAWDDDAWPVLHAGSAATPSLSRLLPTGIEVVVLQASTGHGVEARRSVLEWRGAHKASQPERPTPAFVAALDALGASLPGFASTDAGASNLTGVWLATGEVDAFAQQVERIAAANGLARLMRFDAPADAAESLRGSRVLSFGGPGVIAVATFARHPAGVAVVVHCQERLP